MLFKGPGIKPGTKLDFLGGHNSNYRPCTLMPVPACMSHYTILLVSAPEDSIRRIVGCRWHDLVILG